MERDERNEPRPFSLLHEAVTDADLPSEALFQAEQHSEIDELLTCRESVDLIIPRGSNAFVQHIMSRTSIPVMGHADGICHIYVDKDYDMAKAIPIVIDAKTQYTAACNAAETPLSTGISPKTSYPYWKRPPEKNIRLRGTKEAGEIIPLDIIETMTSAMNTSISSLP
ncbi:MAG: hypothetical protein ACLUIQ_10040 [Dialister invisus]